MCLPTDGRVVGVVITVRVDREKVVQEAQKLVAKGRLDKAVIEYQKLVKANPNDDRSLLKIAELQTRMKSYDAAVSTYEQVAAYYASQGFSAKAMAIYKQIRGLIQQHLPESKGHYGPVVDKLADLYMEAGLKGDAVATYTEYAAHLHRVGRSDELLPVFRKIVELKDDDLNARLQLIEMLRTRGEHQEADEHLVAYGDRLVHLGRIDEGLMALDNVAQRNVQDAQLARKVADLYLDRNGPGDAMTALTRMQACFVSTKRDIETLRVLARALTTIGQRPKAVEVRKLMVKIARDNGDIEIAQALVDELMEEFPRDHSLQELAATVYPDRVVAPPVPMPDDAPEVEAAPAIAFSEESFEMIEESIVELGEDALDAASSFPAPPPYVPQPEPGRAYEPAGWSAPRKPEPVAMPRPLSSEFKAPRPAPPPPARRPPQPARPYEVAEHRPRPNDRPPSDAPLADGYEDFGASDDLDADYDALMPNMRSFEEDEPTLARKSSASNPTGAPDPLDFGDSALDDFGDDALSDDAFGDDAFGGGADEGFDTSGMDDFSLSEPPRAMPSRPAPSKPDYVVDEALEQALEEADFFASQSLFDDALSALEELIPRYPGHPLLIERMQYVRAAMRAERDDNP